MANKSKGSLVKTRSKKTTSPAFQKALGINISVLKNENKNLPKKERRSHQQIVAIAYAAANKKATKK